MKKLKIILAVVVALAAAYILVFGNVKEVFAKSDGLDNADAGDVAIAGGSTAPNTTQAVSGVNIISGSFAPRTDVVKDALGFPLIQGDRGERVEAVQRALNRNFNSALVVDGIFGPKTYKSISANGFNAEALSYREYLEILGV